MAHIHERSHAHPVSEFPELLGQGLRLRQWRADQDTDVDAWLRGLTDPDFRRWNTPMKPVTDLDSARDSLGTRSGTAPDGSRVSFCVTDLATGAILGHLGVNDIDPFIRVARVGYWVLPEARGRRVATRALGTRWAFDSLGLNRLELGHALGHDASCRVAEHCGFRYEGTLRGAMFEAERQDVFRDVHLHGRIAQDPEPDDTISTATAAP
ncbi:GNAT family N-acetyltransferase [Streptomyces sp. AK08-02]|uniref:GNAT family N-acetyltransferase n=1 Tax=Streptomyces sp. AK08-02 TaxID=3028654 RepID=UPI0029AAF7CF|nr:GNAT family N-acetyltransferase [Streptomyces sp. AK08-02]MDX3750977.1 GNAT family N-acetyltransferase [Streptomyces sp. AK08-02]